MQVLCRKLRVVHHLSVSPRARLGTDLAPGADLGHQRRLAGGSEPQNRNRSPFHRRRQRSHASRARARTPRSLRCPSRSDAARLRSGRRLGKAARHVRPRGRGCDLMTRTNGTVIKLFVYPRLFAIPNLSPFCCKLETWLRITGVRYELVPTADPRVAPRGKLPFIEDNGVRIADSSIIIEHLSKTRGVDPDVVLTDEQRATALLVQRTIEDH